MHQSDHPRTNAGPGPGRARTSQGPGPGRAWADALASAAAPLLAMTAVAALGLWFARATTLPAGAFPAVLAALVLMAVGVPVDLTGSAAFVAEAQGGITALPLSVTLVGALVTGAVFLHPLRLHAVVRPGEWAARAARTALLWTGLLLLLRLSAQHSFTVPTGDPLLDELGGLFGAAPTVGFRAPVLPTIGFGLLWIVVVLALALAASRRAPLPPRLLRYQAAVRPAAHAVLTLLLVYVVIALVAGLVSATVDGHPRDTLAVILLALPNLAWIALGVGLGGVWHGHAGGSIGLPMPHPLASVLQTSQARDVTLDLSSLAQQDGRSWLLAVLAAVLLLLAGLGAALHSPADLRLWKYAAHLAVAMAVAMLLIGLLTRISASLGLSLLGLDSTGGVFLRADLLISVPLAALWGALAGLLGALMARPIRPRSIRPGR